MDTPMQTRNLRLILFAIVAIALLARIPQMHLSIGNDEPFSIDAASRSWSQMNMAVVSDFVHPPLHYYLLHMWFDIFGVGIQRARWISVIFGVATVPILYLLGRYLFGPTAGLTAALLLGVAPFPAIYSQIARPYTMHLFLSLCASYLFIVAIRERRATYWWAFVACAALVMYTLYYGAFILLALLGFLLLFRNRYTVPRSWLGGGALVLVLAYIPWVVEVITHRLASPKAMPGRMASFPFHWYTPITIFNRFSSSPHDPEPAWSFVLGGILFGLPAVVALWTFWKRAPKELSAAAMQRENLIFILMLTILPLIAILSLGLLHVRFQPRYTLLSTPYYYLLVACGISLLPGRLSRATLLAGSIVYSVFALVDHSYLHPENPDIRHALSFLAKVARPEDCAVFPEGVLRQWTNDHGAPPFRLIDGRPDEVDPTGCRRTWVVASAINQGYVIAKRVGEFASLVQRRHFYKLEVLLFQTQDQPASARLW